MKAVRGMGICAMLILALAGRSPGETFTHDGVTFYCSPAMKNTYRSFGPELLKNTYRFVRFCKSAGYGNEGNNVDQHQITYDCTWDAAAGRATEEVNDEFIYYYKGQAQNVQSYQNTLTADCAADPWLNDIDCANPMKGPQYPTMWAFDPPYPISAELMEPSTRKYLKDQANAIIRQLPPEILLPKPNGGFVNGQMICEAKSTIPDEDDPSKWRIEIELNMDKTQPGAHDVPLKNSRGVSGLGTAWISMDLPYNGWWLVRARSASPYPDHEGEWSPWVRFSIAGSKGPQLGGVAKLEQTTVMPLPGTGAAAPTLKSPTPGQVCVGSVKVQAAPPQETKTTKVNLEFTHNSQPIQNAPKWDVFAVVSGYDTAANPTGITINAGQFPSPGKWRVRAQVALPGAAWSAPVEFDVQKPQLVPGVLRRGDIIQH